MTVTAVLVNYHTGAMLEPLLQDLCGDPLVASTIVVDNSGELHRELGFRHEKIRTITNTENRGFGSAVNQAVAHADGEWMLVINPDIRLCDGCLEALVAAGERYDCALLGPRFYWDDRLQFRLPPATGGSLWLDVAQQAAEQFALDRELFSFYWTLRHQRFWEAETPFFEPFLTGACLLVAREWAVSRQHRIFDERFFLYFEDTDLCARAMSDGIRPLCVPQARAIHYWDQSPAPERAKSELMAQAHRTFIRKYYGSVHCMLPKGGDPAPPVVDLGEPDAPPTFLMDMKPEEASFFFEIGVNLSFVPFAQASTKTNRFAFPPEIWTRLGRGIYYGRARGALSGTKSIWMWKKT